MNENIIKLLENSNFITKEIKDHSGRSSQLRWENKEVKSFKTIFKPSEESLKYVSTPIDGTISINENVVYNNDPSLEIKTSKIIKNGFSRSTCGIKIDFDKTKLNKFNRVSLWINIKATGFQNFYFHFMLGKKGIVHTASVEINKWQRIMWELDEKLEDEVEEITVTPFLFGCPPEALTDVCFYVNKIDLEEVDLDYVKGWELNNRIAYCHAGYFNDCTKIALTQNIDDIKFYLLNEDNKIVYSDEATLVTSELGDFYKINFTNFDKIGKYKIKIDKYETNYFDINENPYLSSLVKSLNFLRLLRCGEDIDGVHSACHLNCKTVNEETQSSVPNFGGWHDAGDLSQFEICTAEMAHALLDLSFNIKDDKLKQRVIDEAKVGISWLLRTRFNDGSRALAVSYSLWRNNELDYSDNSISISKAEKGPFESFCSAAALAVAARVFEDEIYSSWCLRVAKEDFEFARKWYKQGIYTKRWGKNIDSQVCGQGLIAAAELYEVTKDSYYIDIAVEYANIIMSCQEKEYLLFKSIRGFFYEDVDHKYVLSYEHRGHEQSPIHGLCRILQVYPEIEISDKIIESLHMYEEYVIQTLSHTNPYYLLPGHVYNLNKVNYEHFTIPGYMCTHEEGQKQLQDQIKSGIHIKDDWYLRIFPIAVQRRGFHATLLSKAKGVSMIYKTLNNNTMKQVAINQLEWILGKNPFASSTMYGEGDNYHPLYVAFSKQMVGSLPVGIQTEGLDDLPYWPTHNNAVFKEIWGHTTGKYLWVLSDLI